MKSIHNLVIPKVPIEFKQTFEDLADGLHLTKLQFLQLLLIQNGFSQSDKTEVFNSIADLKEWRDSITSRFFEIGNY